MNRRDFLFGGLAGVSVGAGLIRVREREGDDSPENIENVLLAKSSYAQQGEDLVLKNIFDTLQIPVPTYIDVGAYDPIIGSNTYLLYQHGSRGVLVEPNPSYFERLKRVRKRDTVLNVGIGVTDQKEADYYVFAGDGQLNTFSKSQADKHVKLSGAEILKRVMKMPLVNINEVLKENFQTAPNLFSIDVEGLDLDIVKSLDFDRFRPQVFCIETSMLGTGKVDERIVAFMKSKGYSIRGGSFVNSIFLDDGLL